MSVDAKGATGQNKPKAAAAAAQETQKASIKKQAVSSAATASQQAQGTASAAAASSGAKAKATAAEDAKAADKAGQKTSDKPAGKAAVAAASKAAAASPGASGPGSQSNSAAAPPPPKNSVPASAAQPGSSTAAKADSASVPQSTSAAAAPQSNSAAPPPKNSAPEPASTSGASTAPKADSSASAAQANSVRPPPPKNSAPEPASKSGATTAPKPDSASVPESKNSAAAAAQSKSAAPPPKNSAAAAAAAAAQSTSAALPPKNSAPVPASQQDSSTAPTAGSTSAPQTESSVPAAQSKPAGPSPKNSVPVPASKSGSVAAPEPDSPSLAQSKDSTATAPQAASAHSSSSAKLVKGNFPASPSSSASPTKPDTASPQPVVGESIGKPLSQSDLLGSEKAASPGDDKAALGVQAATKPLRGSTLADSSSARMSSATSARFGEDLTDSLHMSSARPTISTIVEETEFLALIIDNVSGPDVEDIFNLYCTLEVEGKPHIFVQTALVEEGFETARAGREPIFSLRHAEVLKGISIGDKLNFHVYAKSKNVSTQGERSMSRFASSNSQATGTGSAASEQLQASTTFQPKEPDDVFLGKVSLQAWGDIDGALLELPVKMRTKLNEGDDGDAAGSPSPREQLDPMMQIKVVNTQVQRMQQEVLQTKRQVEELRRDVKVEDKPKTLRLEASDEGLAKGFRGDGGSVAEPWWMESGKRRRDMFGDRSNAKKEGMCYVCGVGQSFAGGCERHAIITQCSKCSTWACRDHSAECGLCHRVICADCNAVHRVVHRLCQSQWRCDACDYASRNSGSVLSKWHKGRLRPQ
eukprot:TRINITY_DN10389_c0_g1_i2.p1 TRINITY_DN10389_c0_g1~~TRINITY_DN10389_c0_g1_i2.p1  ORF type:complete len:815 (-),score=235.33 TRINITY_DN10389_c0_g1_i2:124-2568(-)